MADILTEAMFNTENSLGTMLRKHTTELDLVSDLAEVLTARIMKQSDLTAEGIGAAEAHPVLMAMTGEALKTIEKKNSELASAAVAVAEELKNRKQTLIQGDLTAEKVFVAEEKIGVESGDRTFAGPFGYDVAALMISGLMGWCHGTALIEDEYDKDDFCDCCLDLVSDLADQLVWNYDGLYQELATAPAAKEEGFKAAYLSSMMPDLAAAAGLEALRVLTGDRPSPILSEITDSDKREEAKAVILHFAKTCILEKETFFCGADFAAAIESAARQVIES